MNHQVPTSSAEVPPPFIGLKYAEEREQVHDWVDNIFRAQFQLGLDIGSKVWIWEPERSSST